MTAPFLTHVGVESMTIAFPETEYAGHLNEPGYNAIFFEGGVADSWVKQVRIVHSDNGILFDRLSKQLTVDDLVLSGRIGHPGLNIAFTADSLLPRFTGARISFTVTFDHRSSGNVVDGQAVPVCGCLWTIIEMAHTKICLPSSLPRRIFGVGAVNVQGRPRVPGRHFGIWLPAF